MDTGTIAGVVAIVVLGLILLLPVCAALVRSGQISRWRGE